MSPGFSDPDATARLGQLLDRWPATAPPASSAGAAVLIVLRPAPDTRDIETLLIERSVRPEDPGSGQVGLPGGRVERGDTSLRETALRESEEEVGLGPLDLMELPRYVGTDPAPAFGLSVGIFAAPLAIEARTPAARAADEVAGVFWLPSRTLTERRRVERQTRDGRIQVEATVFDGHVLWGFTRRVLREFFAVDGHSRPPLGSAWRAGGSGPPASP